jgi:hypothetical protein
MKKKLLFIPLGIVAGSAIVFLLGYGVMSLWNWLMPVIFGLTTITFWQAIGLFVLSKIFFGSFKGRGGGGPHFWKQRMAERMERMSPEDKEHFREKMKSRWGKWMEKSEE